MAASQAPWSAFIAEATVPEHIARLVRPSLIDTFAVAIAGSRAPESDRLHAWAAKIAGQASSGVTNWARGSVWSGDLGVLVNGADSHVLDYDDSNGVLRLHPSAVMLPPLVAIAEQRRLPLAQVAEAAVIGYETMTMLAGPHLEAQYQRGWHITTTIGALGAVAATGRLLGLDPPRLQAAVGLCGSGLGAVRANFGTSAKSYQVGVAAANAYRATLLAEAGADSGDILDPASSVGFAAVYGGEPIHLDIPDGSRWAFASNPPKMKSQPTCFATHHAIAAAQELQGRVSPDDIRRVDITTSATGLVPLIGHAPRSPTEARFSMPYVIACTLREGAPRLEAFTASGFADRREDPLAAKVFAREARGDGANGTSRWASVRVETPTATYEVRADALADVTSPAALRGKVEECLAFGGATAFTADEFIGLFDANWDGSAHTLTEAIRLSVGA